MKSLGVSPIVATVIIVAVAIAIAIAFGLWVSGIAGYFTQYEDVRVSDISSFGPAAVVYLTNHGPQDAYIERCVVNNKYTVRFIAAYDVRTKKSYLVPSGSGKWTVLVPSGRTVELWMLIPTYLSAGQSVELACTTTRGTTFTKISNVYQNFQKIGRIKLVAYIRCSGYPDIPMRVIEIDPLLWTYNYTEWSAPDANGNRQLTKTYSGNIPVIRGVSEAYVKDVKPQAPVVIVINPKAGVADWNFTWHGWKTGVTGCPTQWVKNYTFFLEKIQGAVPGLDFLIFWEDTWHPGFHFWNDTDSWTDHVVRVTWMRAGTVRVAVYHASGCYYHEFWIGDTKYYDKGHGESLDCCKCGPSCGGRCNNCPAGCPTGDNCCNPSSPTNVCSYFIRYPCLVEVKRP